MWWSRELCHRGLAKQLVVPQAHLIADAGAPSEHFVQDPMGLASTAQNISFTANLPPMYNIARLSYVLHRRPDQRRGIGSILTVRLPTNKPPIRLA